MNSILKTALFSLSICIAMLADVSALEAPAAILKRIEGSVLVNKGETYRSAVEGMDLHVGDRIMIMENANAVLVYEDGCVAEFKQNQILIVRSRSTCDGGMAYTRTKGPLYAAPLGGTTTTGGGGSYGLSPAGTAGIFGTALVVGAAVLSTDNDDSISAQ